MKKSQLILIAVGVLAVVGLYALPKVVVDNDSTGAKMDESADSSVADSTGQNLTEMHESELSSDSKAEADQLKAIFFSSSQAENKVSSARQLSVIYQKEGLFDSAAYFSSAAADLVPSDLAVIEEAGKANYEAYSFALDKNKVAQLAEKTRFYLNKVLEKDPSRLDLKTKIAMTYVSSSNPMQGITMLREVLAQDPQNEDGLFNMGVLSMQSGQYQRAAERFEELVKYHPDNIQGQFYLAVSYFESKEKNKAKAQFEEVKKMTQDPMILNSIQTYLDQL